MLKCQESQRVWSAARRAATSIAAGGRGGHPWTGLSAEPTLQGSNPPAWAGPFGPCRAGTNPAAFRGLPPTAIHMETLRVSAVRPIADKPLSCTPPFSADQIGLVRLTPRQGRSEDASRPSRSSGERPHFLRLFPDASPGTTTVAAVVPRKTRVQLHARTACSNSTTAWRRALSSVPSEC